MIYSVIVFDEGQEDRSNSLQAHLEERLESLGMDGEVEFIPYLKFNKVDTVDKICLILFFCTESEKYPEDLIFYVENGLRIIPIYSTQQNFEDEVPELLSIFHAFAWEDATDVLNELTNEVLENLKITNHDRQLFISYRRTDGYGVADQLFDSLNRKSFYVYKDDFVNRIGGEFQKELYQNMDKTGFLVYLQSPEAGFSKWVKVEIDRALANNLGIAVIRFPGVINTIPGLKVMPTYELSAEDLEEMDHPNGERFLFLKDQAKEEVIQFIHTSHSERLIARKKYFDESISLALKAKSEKYEISHEGISRTSKDELIQIDVRTPNPFSFHQLKLTMDKKGCKKGILVHGALEIPKNSIALNDWIIDGNEIRWKHIDDFINEI